MHRAKGLFALALVLGVLNTIALFGRDPITPTNIEWIAGDPGTYYAGWAFYRHDPHLRFPLTWTDRLGYPVGTSIAWLDAIPLVAVLMRPFSPVLPEPFQYLGLYSALCFVLQAYFGFRLCARLFPSDRVFSLIGGGFFLLSAPLTWRAFGHTALLSQWLILAGLDAYLRDPGARVERWMARLWIVLALAAAITPYIAVMCFLIALAAVARLVLEHRCSPVRAAVLLAGTVAVLMLTASTFGVLVTGDTNAYWAAGYGAFSMNLNAPVNPMTTGSILLPALPLAHAQQYEGYNYLGLGVIALLAVSLGRNPRLILRVRGRRWLPLAGLAVVCTALAVSTSVTLGSATLVEIPLPSALANTIEGLRASGRLFWPAYYLILCATLVFAFRSWKPPARTAIVGIALALQFADLTPLRANVRAALDRRFPTPLTSPLWQGLGRAYDTLVLVPPYQCAPYTGAGGHESFVTFGELAAAEHMRTNSYYAARYSRAQLDAHCVDLLRAQLEGPLDPRSAYVATDAVRTIWELNGVAHRCQRADGFNLCTAGNTTPAASPPAVPAAAPYLLGDTIGFLKQGSARQYMTFGWQDPVPNGTWTQGPVAMLRLGIAPPIDASRPLLLDAEALPFVSAEHPQLDVGVFVNNRQVDRWTFGLPSQFSRRQARIPGALAAARGGLDIEFRVRNPGPPLLVGICLRRLTVRYE